MTQPICETCRFWKPPFQENNFGQCRRHAPAVRLIRLDGDGCLTETRDAEVVWAETDVDDWCGEHQPKN